MLTYGTGGTTIWATPAIGGVESIIIQLSVETGSGSVSGVPISVQVEGENESRALVTDATGKATTKIDHGLQYTVTFGTISGYLPVSSLVYRASLPVRIIYGVYREDAAANNEHVVVHLIYTTGTARAQSLNVETNSGTTSYSVVNNICEFNIPKGTNYIIKYTYVEGYSTPANQSFTASFSAITVKAYYVGAMMDLIWIKRSDGSTIPFNDISASNVSDIVGLRISSSLLAQQSASFIVPIEYLINSNIIIGGQTIVTASSKSATWGPQILLLNLPCYTNASAAMTPDTYLNLNGENNTNIYLAEAASMQIGSLPAMAWCKSLSYTINGQSKNAFLGSYAQMKTLSDNQSSIDACLYNMFGVHIKGFNIGYWWCSTQYSADGAVLLDIGGFSYNYKTNYNSVVPFLAY